MANKDQIEKWLHEGTITRDQADKMSADTKEYKKEQGSNKLIAAISTIGSILLGIGAILFIASNWTSMPDIMKVILLVGSTFGAYWTGYYFKYQKKNLPKVGSSLIFLGALLFGATIFLIAQIYHINANSHTLILIWIVGILPFVYGFTSSSIAALSAVLCYIWIGLFVFKDTTIWNVEQDIFFLPVLYVIFGVLLFGIGTLHHFSDKVVKIAHVYRLAGLKAVMLSLFLLTFHFFAGHHDEFNIRDEIVASDQFTFLITAFAVIAVILTVINIFFNPAKTRTSNLENGIALGLVAIALIFFFFPATTNIYVVIFNLILATVILALLYIGYNGENMRIVNIGMFWLTVFIIVRYFDFLWDLLPRSLFFMIGGLILVLGGIALERKGGS